MDKKYTLKVSAFELMVLQKAIESIQIYGKDAVVIAELYTKIRDAVTRSETDRETVSE